MGDIGYFFIFVEAINDRAYDKGFFSADALKDGHQSCRIGNGKFNVNADVPYIPKGSALHPGGWYGSGYCYDVQTNVIVCLSRWGK